MKKFSKLLVCVLTICIFMINLSACSSKEQNNGTSSPSNSPAPGKDSVADSGSKDTAPAKDVVLKFSYWRLGTDPQASIMKDIIAEFEKENPGIKIETDSTPLADISDQLTIQALGGDTPDIMIMPFQQVPRFVDMGVVEPLDDYLAKDAGFKDGFYDYLLQMGTIDGVIYGLPQDIACNTLIYNKDMFAAAGLPDTPPQSYEEFVEYAQALTDTEKGVAGFGLGLANEAGNQARLMSMYWASGAYIVGADEKTIGMDAPEGIAALQRIIDLSTKYGVTTASPLELGYSTMLSMFQNGQIAMMQGNIGTIAPVLNVAPDMNIGIAPFKWDDYGYSMECALTFMTTNCKNKEEAWKFIQYLLGFEGIKAWSIPLNYLPPRPDVVELPEVQDNQYIQAYLNILPEATMIPRLRKNESVFEVVYREVALAFQGSKTAEKASQDAAADIRKLIEE
jgi:ABC-type glycerol-3-phosphate transport system substrate-binding protein